MTYPFRDEDQRARFWSHVHRDPDHCWIWLGASSSGYGWFRTSETCRAHRIALMEALGHGLTASEYALHRCDTPLCVRPAHLFVGSAADNTADMMAKGREARYWKGKRRNFTPEALANISAAARIPRPVSPEVRAKIAASVAASWAPGGSRRQRSLGAG